MLLRKSGVPYHRNTNVLCFLLINLSLGAATHPFCYLSWWLPAKSLQYKMIWESHFLSNELSPNNRVVVRPIFCPKDREVEKRCSTWKQFSFDMSPLENVDVVPACHVENGFWNHQGKASKARGRCILSGKFIATSAEVTPNGGLVRESPPKWP